jgi:hypothetical protein
MLPACRVRARGPSRCRIEHFLFVTHHRKFLSLVPQSRAQRVALSRTQAMFDRFR